MTNTHLFSPEREFEHLHAIEVMPLPELTSVEYLSEAKAVLANAMDVEEKSGINAAGLLYMTAERLFYSSLALTYRKEEPEDFATYLELATCQNAMARWPGLPEVKTTKHSPVLNRREALEASERKHLQRAWDLVMEKDGLPKKDEVATVAIVRAGLLEDLGDSHEAHITLVKATQVMYHGEGSIKPELAGFVEEQAREIEPAAIHEAALVAVHDLAADSHNYGLQ